MVPASATSSLPRGAAISAPRLPVPLYGAEASRLWFGRNGADQIERVLDLRSRLVRQTARIEHHAAAERVARLLRAVALIVELRTAPSKLIA